MSTQVVHSDRLLNVLLQLDTTTGARGAGRIERDAWEAQLTEGS